ncbi:NAD(P)H-hydrate dehydratase [Acidovorax sp.]|uniref:NAD(P)H-hydrate dehydratase n=1 Tax=Acidovorax sp. TaxID=1872122 RepID=UPI00391F9D0B
MHRITPHQPHALHNTAATRRIERAAADSLPAHTLMQRAGQAVAQLAQALAPHARTVWIACGAGNNGGDGLEAAMHLRRSGRRVVVTWLGTPETAPPDARQSWERALAAGVEWADTAPDTLTEADLCIDALLGIGITAPAHGSAPRPPNERLQACLRQLQASAAPVLSVDLPSGLDADTGQFGAGLAPEALLHHAASPRHTLSLLTLKPGLFTAAGRDAAGSAWLDDLGVAPGHEPPNAWLCGPPLPAPRQHASHKGSHGDVAVIGGEGLAQRGMGMAGAALLAASAALHQGAGRVLVAPLDAGHLEVDTGQPELMLRRFGALDLAELTVVCGCGGGEAVASVLSEVIARSARLVLDADALNAISLDAALHALVVARGQHGQPTVLTPHPLEAARLLGLTTAEVQADRLNAAQQLAAQFNCVAVLKGSGTVISAADRVPAINPTGNGLLATAGTGDVLAGMVGSRLAAGASALRAASEAVYAHGLAADHWPEGLALTASTLARRIGR